MRGDQKVRGRHASNSARPGPPSDRPVPPAAPASPRWKALVLMLGLGVAVALFVKPSTAPKPRTFTYSALRVAVQDDRVATAAIDEKGRVTGDLKKGGRYTSQIPTALGDDQFTPMLEQHGVQIRGVASKTSFLSIALSMLPIFLIVGVFLWMGRRTGRQMAAGLGGIGKSRAKVYDAQKPSTRFGDIAGYEGGEARGQRGRRLPQAPRPLRRGRRRRPQRRAHGRAAGDGQDAAGPGGGRARPACRSSRSPAPASWRCSSGSAPPGSGTCSPTPASGHRRSSSSTRSTPSASAAAAHVLQRRARADPQPVAGRDGRVRPDHRRRGDGGHEPARDPRPGAAAARAVRPPGRDPAAQAGASGPPSWPSTPGASSSAPTSTSTSWPGPRPDSPAPTWPTWSTRRPSSPCGPSRRRDQRRRLLRGPRPDPARAPGRGRTPCCPTRSTRSPCTRPATPWSRPSPSTPTRWPRSRSCPPAGPWA